MSAFKICPLCKHEWDTRENFLGDRYLSIIGFMADEDSLEKSAYLFNHVLPGKKCGGTLAVTVDQFLDLYDGPLYEDLKLGSQECSGYCARVDVLERCNAECRNAVARKIIHLLVNQLSQNHPGAP